VKILLIRTAKGKQKWANTAVDLWKKRFSHRLPLEESILKPAPDHYSTERKRQVESQKVMELL